MWRIQIVMFKCKGLNKNKTSKTRLSTIVKYSFREITNAHCTIILKRPWACLHWNTKFNPQASLPWGGLVNFNESIFIKYWNNSNTHIKTTRKRQRLKKKCQSKQGLEINFLQVNVIWYKSYWKYYYQLELPSLSSTIATWSLLCNKMGGCGITIQNYGCNQDHEKPFFFKSSLKVILSLSLSCTVQSQISQISLHISSPISPLSLGENRRRHENKKSWLEILQNIKVIPEKFG